LPSPAKMAATFGQPLSNPAMDRRTMVDMPARLWSFAQAADRAAGSMRVLGDIIRCLRAGVSFTVVDPKQGGKMEERPWD
jgi:hypothetical protein